MPDESKICPQCHRLMQFRLGEYECPACGYFEKETAEHPAAEQAPRREPWQTPASPPAPPPPAEDGSPRLTGASSIATRRSDGSREPPPAFDPAPALDNEKMYLLGLFVLKAMVNIFAGASVTVDPTVTQALLSPFLGRFAAELISLALIVLVIYVPVIPLKWACASWSCLIGLLSLAGVLFGMFLIPIVSIVMPISGLFSFIGILITLLNIVVYLWLASVLYRDISRLQAG
ncbi:hypothetical protein IIA79_06425 [bacterium]|nr:hypothetical protein [bacterium]